METNVTLPHTKNQLLRGGQGSSCVYEEDNIEDLTVTVDTQTYVGEKIV